jgi:hypothetical protein
MGKPMSASETTESSSTPTRLVRRADRERWPIRRQLRRQLADRLAMLVQDITLAPDESVAAARALLSTSQHNLGNVSKTIKAIDFEDLERRLTKVEECYAGNKESAPW